MVLVFLSGFTTLFLIACTLLYLYAKHVNNYWKRHNIPYIEGTPFLGNIADLMLMKKSSSELIVDLYNHKDAVDKPFVGIHVFQQPALLIRDPELIKVFLIKDFEYFPNRHSRLSKRVDPLGAQILFFLKDSIWRQFRLRNSPMFTGLKMKSVFPLIAEIGQKLDARLSKLTMQDAIEHEIHDLASFYTGDVIASVAFNIHANSIEDRNNPFHIITSKVFDFSIHRSLAMAAAFFLPCLSQILRARFFPDVTAKFLRSAIVNVIADREKTETRRNDVIDNLINFKRQMKEKFDADSVDGDLLYAQAAAYYTAGFGTTASALGFSLLELSKHPECQNRLRNEIRDILLQHDKNICYEAIMRMDYLQMVILEAMRIYPTLPFLDRECTLTDGRTHYSFEPHCDFPIPNGMPVYIPAYALHRDPKYFPEPEKFDPTRFSPENKLKIPSCAYLPFGAGPRNCIGGRLGLLIVKVGLVHFMLNHRVVANDRTPREIKLDKRAMIIQSEGGIYCDVVHDPLFK